MERAIVLRDSVRSDTGEASRVFTGILIPAEFYHHKIIYRMRYRVEPDLLRVT